MIGIYFSGTGNTQYCVEKFVQGCDPQAQAFSIETEAAAAQIRQHTAIVLGYSVQFSNLPTMLRDFMQNHAALWQGKKVFVIATMGLFSGDGAGLLARLLRRYGAVVTGGLHLKMPDSICDEKALKRTLLHNQKLVAAAGQKIEKAVLDFQNGNPPQEGLGSFAHLAGLFGQRLYFYHKTRRYSDKLKIAESRCTGCGLCAARCPMHNLRLHEGKAAPVGRCTMCYRCANQCPAQAITLLGKAVVEQGCLEKYL